MGGVPVITGLLRARGSLGLDGSIVGRRRFSATVTLVTERLMLFFF